MVHQTMNTASKKAPSASNRMSHMGIREWMIVRASRAPGAAGKALALRWRLSSSLVILGLLAACAGGPGEPPAPAPARPLPAAGERASAPAQPPPLALHPRSRWVAASWSDLPGWDVDRVEAAWPALLRSCERAAADWQAACEDARALSASDEATRRRWLQQRLQVWRVEAPDGGAQGLATGYFEPQVRASRVRRGAFTSPLYRPPADLAVRRPYWTRQQLDTLPEAQRGLRGRELAFVQDPLDGLLLQVQGSGRLSLTEADGSVRDVRVAFAGHNDQPYRSVGRWLLDQGELRPDQANWPAIRAWARMNPARLQELLWSNPRVVFFREEGMPDPLAGPRGAQGVALSPGRSVAVDKDSVPLGTPVWIDTSEPLTSTPLRRLALAQDTGGAITGAVRIDLFWGWGDEAEQQAGRMKQPLRMWVLWPRTR